MKTEPNYYEKWLEILGGSTPKRDFNSTHIYGGLFMYVQNFVAHVGERSLQDDQEETK